jgi:hypothetical protein
MAQVVVVLKQLLSLSPLLLPSIAKTSTYSMEDLKPRSV